MKKQETIYREILYRAIEKKEFSFTQLELSKKLKLSLSNINLAIKKLDSMGAVKTDNRGFKVIDIKKILYLWASSRNIKEDIIFKTRIEAPVREIERIMPNVNFGAYSAYKYKFKDVPADYSEVYIYSNEKGLEIIKKRIENFKKSDNNPNLIVLKKDELFNTYDTITIAQIFVDLWNLKEWYAKEFFLGLERRIFKE